jgi:ferrous iron transport protein B
VVCLNFWDDTLHKGVALDPSALENLLGVPVVTTSALSGEGINNLVMELSRARESNAEFPLADQWKNIGVIVDRVQKLTHRHHTLRERVSDFTIHPMEGRGQRSAKTAVF